MANILENHRGWYCVKEEKQLLFWRVSDIGESDSKYEEVLGIPPQFFFIYILHFMDIQEEYMTKM